MKLMAVIILLVQAGCSGASEDGFIQPVAPMTVETAIPSGASHDDFNAAVVKAAKNRGWRLERINSTTINADLKIRTHEASVVIAYEKTKYTITYKNSVNLDYDKKTHTIHPKYNQWVRNLDKDISDELAFKALKL